MDGWIDVYRRHMEPRDHDGWHDLDIMVWDLGEGWVLERMDGWVGGWTDGR